MSELRGMGHHQRANGFERKAGAMRDHITVEIPQQWVQGLDWEQDAILEEIIQLGIRQLKIRRALALYRAGNVSLGYAAEKVGLPKRELIREARAQGIEPAFDEETVP